MLIFLCKTSNVGWERGDCDVRLKEYYRVLLLFRVYLKLCGGDLDPCLQCIDDARGSCGFVWDELMRQGCVNWLWASLCLGLQQTQGSFAIIAVKCVRDL